MRRVECSANELGFNISLDPIQEGDLYLAERNNGPKIFRCRKVVHTGSGEPDYILPRGWGYRFDVQECVKVAK